MLVINILQWRHHERYGLCIWQQGNKGVTGWPRAERLLRDPSSFGRFNTMNTFSDVLNRLRAEFSEMPGLRLTPRQMERLCGVDPMQCQGLLDVLMAERFLSMSSDGHYARCTEERFRPWAVNLNTRPEPRFVKASWLSRTWATGTWPTIRRSSGGGCTVAPDVVALHSIVQKLPSGVLRNQLSLARDILAIPVHLKTRDGQLPTRPQARFDNALERLRELLSNLRTALPSDHDVADLEDSLNGD
jgi:hypothetical protein